VDYLIAQIAGRKRWTQINIPLDLANFFGSASSVGFVDVLPVSNSGKSWPAEHRKFTLKKSINWVFGLSSKLATDADHPGPNQPIAVFRRTNGAQYRYCLVMPADPPYAALEMHLVSTYKGPARNRKRVLASASQISALYPSCPL
jgi:hypothetical protein